jgi:lipopolysaccharide biosynthesis protein
LAWTKKGVTLSQPNHRARLLAFYLPQFHPIPENDAWWGPGYTDWVAVARGRPLFPGHQQPTLPGELGFYDLRLPETRAAQAELAQAHGIEGFCYWHYWFSGRQLLERPFNEVLTSGEPRLPFCLGWANHTWNSVWWFGVRGKSLIMQEYPGRADHQAHFNQLLPAFTDARYMTVNGKPIFFIYNPYEIPEARAMTDLWRELAHAAGLPGLHLVGLGLNRANLERFGFDAATYEYVNRIKRIKPKFPWVKDWAYRYRFRRLLRRPVIYQYRQITQHLLRPRPAADADYPTVVPNWDNTPRSMYSGMVFHGSTPELFRAHLREALAQVAHRPPEHRLIFVKSWNEWGEGNYLEPDRRFGRAYLEAMRDEVTGAV